MKYYLDCKPCRYQSIIYSDDHYLDKGNCSECQREGIPYLTGSIEEQKIQFAIDKLKEIDWNLCTESECEGYCRGCKANEIIRGTLTILGDENG